MVETVIGDKTQIGEWAAKKGARRIRDAIAMRGSSTIIVATGASQFDLLAQLVREPDIDWTKVTAFHLDEYIGLPISHGASFRRYLAERFVEPLGGAVTFMAVAGDAADIGAEVARLNRLIAGRKVDVCFAGIGENGHLAFNDPPADFDTTDPYIVVALDEACRRQQLGEGWFPSLADVPTHAISMSIRQMLLSDMLILTVPDRRKAEAVRGTLEGPVSNAVPASIVRTHDATFLYLDPQSASLLTNA